MTIFRLERLFHPDSVAVLGAATPTGARVLANLRQAGFPGAVRLAETVADLQPVDLALLCTADVPDAFAALGRLGTPAAIVFSPADDLHALAAATGVRALGPDSFGLAVPSIGLNATTSHIRPMPGRVALVSQSSALCRAVLDWAEPNGVGFSHIIGIGGNHDLGFGTALDWLSRDPGTGAILLDIRRLKDPRAFLSAARAAARLRPVVALRAGFRLLDTDGAAEAVFAAALRRCGVLSVTRFADLLAAAETLTRARPMRRDAVGIVTNAVGPAWLAADAALRKGLTLAGEIVPVDTAALAGATQAMAGGAEVGGVLVVHAPSGPEDAAGIAALAAAARAAPVPVLVAAMGETTGAAHRATLVAAGVPVFATPEQAVRGLLHLAQHRRTREAARELPPSAVLDVAPDRAAVSAILAGAGDRRALAQDEALGVLAAYGIATVPTRCAADAAAAAVAAEALGYPVVLKRRRSVRPKEGGRGALMLDLRDVAQLGDAVRLLARRRTDLDGFLVQPQQPRARELRLQMTEDALFGPVIGFGQGGTAASVQADLALDLPPLNLPLARALIGRTRIGRTLGRLHDLPAVDGERVADALVRVSQLIVDFPAIAEIDINPLFADAAGVRAADAWIRLRAPDAPPARLAIAPYPVELAGTFRGRRETFLVRPIRPEDAAAHTTFFARLPPEDVRFRFFTAVRELPPEQMARLTQVDYDREIAFIAIREASGETVGVARLVRETATTSEFAIVVQPDAKGQGLATHLMRRLIDWARSQGVATVVGQVLSDNTAMLGFVRHLGFTLHRMAGDETVMEACLDLA